MSTLRQELLPWLREVAPGVSRIIPPKLKDFEEGFRYVHWLAAHDPEVMDNYPNYFHTMADIRSAFVAILRRNHVPGSTRRIFNDHVERTMRYSYEWYLYCKSPSCSLCNGPFASFKEVTKDHIIPTFLGGPNLPTNRQLAHGHCNVLKGHRPIKQLNMYKSYH